MNKQIALKEFKSKYNPNSKINIKNWNLFTECLCKDGIISFNQYKNWKK